MKNSFQGDKRSRSMDRHEESNSNVVVSRQDSKVSDKIKHLELYRKSDLSLIKNKHSSTNAVQVQSIYEIKA